MGSYFWQKDQSDVFDTFLKHGEKREWMKKDENKSSQKFPATSQTRCTTNGKGKEQMYQILGAKQILFFDHF